MTSNTNDAPAVDLDDTEFEMPALFIGHGSPMNAIEDTEFSQAWANIGQSLPRPKAIVCISAHWETIGTQVTAMELPRTLHDFACFPKPLFDLEYPARGAPELAQLIQEAAVTGTPITLNDDGGLDHGAWSVLCRMFPKADIPVVQLSLDRTKMPMQHYELGKALRPLRWQGVLFMGSGNIVHNLGRLVWKDTAHDWAMAFDEEIKRMIEADDHPSIIHYLQLGEPARLSVPTNEHFLPLLYILGLQEKGEEISFFAEKVTLGAISMRSLMVGSISHSIRPSS